MNDWRFGRGSRVTLDSRVLRLHGNSRGDEILLRLRRLVRRVGLLRVSLRRVGLLRPATEHREAVRVDVVGDACGSSDEARVPVSLLAVRRSPPLPFRATHVRVRARRGERDDPEDDAVDPDARHGRSTEAPDVVADLSDIRRFHSKATEGVQAETANIGSARHKR